MKVEIEGTSNGFIVRYKEEGYVCAFTYVYKSTDDILMLEEVAKRFLKRRIKIEEK